MKLAYGAVVAPSGASSGRRRGAVAAGRAGIADDGAHARDLRAERAEDGVAELGRRRGAADVAASAPRASAASTARLERPRELRLAEAVLERQGERAQHRGRVRAARAGDVGRRAVHRLEDARAGRRRGSPRRRGRARR